MLIGASEVVDWIDWFGGSERPIPAQETVPFLRLQYAGRTYLTSIPWPWGLAVPRRWIEEFFDHPHWWRLDRHWHRSGAPRQDTGFGWFAIEEKGGAEFLRELSAAINDGQGRMPDSLVLPTFDPVGFGFADGERALSAPRDDGDRAYDYARFRDGLALLRDPLRGRPLDIVLWSPQGGLSLG
ncbi:MAG: hypothetical protein DI595_03770 [Agrobacterium fabrum]|uniref:Uncharacterized protein n=1 Tax=Agrobacterium fabrum TaxID=1176649 RepID=A0A2W5FI47_9HYPH|nr:MAG: hypothetical protein DI595_03770 [Agrobacterium fabrum]